MDTKTLEWMNERTNKGNEIQKRIAFLKGEIQQIQSTDGAAIFLYSKDRYNDYSSYIAYGSRGDDKKRIYSIISEVLIAAFEKEIADLEAEFAEL